jgi:hypothetical protein
LFTMLANAKARNMVAQRFVSVWFGLFAIRFAAILAPRVSICRLQPPCQKVLAPASPVAWLSKTFWSSRGLN